MKSSQYELPMSECVRVCKCVCVCVNAIFSLSKPTVQYL